MQDIERNGYNGIGKPEPLKNDLAHLYRAILEGISYEYRIYADVFNALHGIYEDLQALKK